MIRFTIPWRLPLLNVLLRMHWAKRKREAEALAWHVRAAIGVLPAKPFEKAIVQIHRHSPNDPDPDGLEGCKKLLLDVLQPMSKKHPCGLGIITNDDRKHVTCHVYHVQDKQVITDVTIQEIA